MSVIGYGWENVYEESVYDGICVELDGFTMYLPRTSLTPDLIHYPPNFWLNLTSSSHKSVCCLKILKLFPHQNFWRVFNIPVVYLS